MSYYTIRSYYYVGGIYAAPCIYGLKRYKDFDLRIQSIYLKHVKSDKILVYNAYSCISRIPFFLL